MFEFLMTLVICGGAGIVGVLLCYFGKAVYVLYKMKKKYGFKGMFKKD